MLLHEQFCELEHAASACVGVAHNYTEIVSVVLTLGQVFLLIYWFARSSVAIGLQRTVVRM